jgi:hypothetical protein
MYHQQTMTQQFFTKPKKMALVKFLASVVNVFIPAISLIISLIIRSRPGNY